MIPALFFGCTAALRNRMAKTILAQARQRTKGRKIGLLCFKLTFFKKELLRPNIYTLLTPLKLGEWINFETLAVVLVDPPFHKSVQEKLRFHLLACGTYVVYTYHGLIGRQGPNFAWRLCRETSKPICYFLKAATARAIHRRRRWHCRWCRPWIFEFLQLAPEGVLSD